MTDQKNTHEPVLLPKDESVNARLKLHEPVLFSADHREPKVKPPYILIVLTLFGVFGAFWKMSMKKDAPPDPVKLPAKVKVLNN